MSNIAARYFADEFEVLLPDTDASGAHSTCQRLKDAVETHRFKHEDERIDLTISIEATGVQVDVAHRGGGATTVAILIPEPPGYEIRIEYLDWMQTDQPRRPILVDLQPGGEPTTLWGRMIERRISLPTGQADQLPQSLVQGGLFLSLPADDPATPEQARGR